MKFMKNVYCFLIILPLLSLAFGCQFFNNMFGSKTTPLPTAFTKEPSLAEIQSVVNRNSGKIISMECNDARISAPGVSGISLLTTISFERPKRLRLQGQHTITGKEFDIGSNDEQFWLWIRQDPEKKVYTGRHDLYGNSSIAQSIPISPEWIIESLGIVEFSSNEQHEGPHKDVEGNYQISSIRNTPGGPCRKVTTVDSRTGAVLKQELFDAAGNPIAGARMRNHRYDPNSGILYAKTIEIHSPELKNSSLQGSIRLDLGNVRFNTINGGTMNGVFVKPQFPNCTELDLTSGQAMPIQIRERQEVPLYHQSRVNVNPPDYYGSVSNAQTVISAPDESVMTAILPNGYPEYGTNFK